MVVVSAVAAEIRFTCAFRLVHEFIFIVGGVLRGPLQLLRVELRMLLRHGPLLGHTLPLAVVLAMPYT